MADEAIQPLIDALKNPAERSVYLYGSAGSGRSHLLQAACHAQADSLYLPLLELQHFPAQGVFEQVEQTALLCLDDIDCVAGNAEWEEALFHLLNRCQLSGARTVFSAARSPRQQALKLDDLRSRLSAAVVFALPSLTDEQLRDLLTLRVNLLGMSINERVVKYILRRTQRSASAVMQVVELLDKASLARGRILTREFVREVMQW